MNQLSGLIFDLDGVILDSNPFHMLSWKNFLTRRGIAYSEELFYEVMSGKTGESSLELLLDEPLTPDKIRSYLDEINGEYREIFRKTDRVKTIVGVLDFIHLARQEGIRTAMATSAPPGNVELALDRLNLGPLFETILDSTAVSRGKPDPEVYLTALERLGTDRDSTLVFEDSMAGIDAATAAGMRVVGIASAHTQQELLRRGASLVLDNFRGLTPEKLGSLLN